MNFLIDEKIPFMSPVKLKGVLINTGKDGRRFLNIKEQTEIITGETLDFSIAESHRTLLAEIENKYSVVRAVVSGIEANTYVGCPECRKGGFDVEAGEAAYCTSEKCRTSRVLEELSIENVFLGDESGTLQCGISSFNPFDTSDYEIGMMVIASLNKWRKNGDESDNFTINRIKDISQDAYNLEVSEALGRNAENEPRAPASEEDYAALERAFSFESDLSDSTEEHIDKVLSVYSDVCQFYNEVTARDLGRLIHMKIEGDNKKLHPAFKKALELGMITFDASRGLISPANN
jgi:hypothetical protein